jgi:hypothetical protein
MADRGTIPARAAVAPVPPLIQPPIGLLERLLSNCAFC